MKKIFMLLTIFAMTFLVVACSKDDDKNKNPKASVSILVIEMFQHQAENLVLAPRQQIKFKAVVREADGKIITDAVVNWTCSPELGNLANKTGNTTLLTVTADSGDAFFVKADFKGVSKTIPVIVDLLNVDFYLQDDPIISGGAGLHLIKVTLTRRSNNTEDTKSAILWNSSGLPGVFTSNETKSNEYNSFAPKDGISGKVNFEVEVNGIKYTSPDYIIVEQDV